MQSPAGGGITDKDPKKPQPTYRVARDHGCPDSTAATGRQDKGQQALPITNYRVLPTKQGGGGASVTYKELICPICSTNSKQFMSPWLQRAAIRPNLNFLASVCPPRPAAGLHVVEQAAINNTPLPVMLHTKYQTYRSSLDEHTPYKMLCLVITMAT